MPSDPLFRVLIPNAELAEIAPAKIRDYLLPRSHRIGRYKARFFPNSRYPDRTNGQSAIVVSVWFMPARSDVPRFITAYPGDER